MSDSVEMHVFLNFNTPTVFLKLSFISKILNFTMQISAYQEGMKINIEVNEQRRILHISTHWNKRHR